MKLYDQAKQYRKSGKKEYILWEARQNQYHDDCYVLDVEWASRGQCGSIMSYFYTNETGPSLVDVVSQYMNNFKTTGIPW